MRTPVVISKLDTTDPGDRGTADWTRTPLRRGDGGVVVAQADCVVLHSDIDTVMLNGASVVAFVDRVLPLVDGERCRDDLLQLFPAHLHESLCDLLDIFIRLGIVEIVSGDPAPPLKARWRQQDTFLRTWARDPEDARHRIRTARILVIGLDPCGVSLARELAACGVGQVGVADERSIHPDDPLIGHVWSETQIGQRRDDAFVAFSLRTAPWCHLTTAEIDLAGVDLNGAQPPPWDLVIVTEPMEVVGRHRALAHVGQTARIPFLYVEQRRAAAFIGPLVRPGQPPCWQCYHLRTLANAPNSQAAHIVREHFLSTQGLAWFGRASGDLGPIGAMVGQFAALEALKVVSNYSESRMTGQLLVVDLVSLKTTRHVVVPMPWCDVCGGASVLNGESALGAQPLSASSLDELRRALAGWVDPRTGIIADVRLAERDPAERSVHDDFFVAHALPSDYTEGVFAPLIASGCGGKGFDPPEAAIGAVAEAIERYSATRVRLTDLHRARMDDLEGDRIDPRDLVLYEDQSYDRPDFPFARFDPGAAYLWGRGYWLQTNEPVWVPAQLAYYAAPFAGERSYCQVTSNGLAAGRDREDAALRALFEAVERDAVMLSWLCRRPGRRLALDEAIDPRLDHLIELLTRLGATIELYLLDVNLSIPVVLCLGVGDGVHWPGVTVSSAAHLSVRRAVRQALLEQGYSGIATRRDMLTRASDIPTEPSQIRSFLDHARYYIPSSRLDAFAFLRENDADPLSLSTLIEPEHVTLARCHDLLAGTDVRVAFIDVTSPDVALSPFRVARALGTFLQPMSCGYGLERLANPRLHALIDSSATINRDPHPIC